jgi:6-phosphogluconolactonase (cycloisomerase 2 family)
MHLARPHSAAALLALLGAAACTSDPQSDAPLAVNAAGALREQRGAVVVATNATAGNALLVFPRWADGSLGTPVAYPTGGTGTGGGLGNQGGLAATARYLLAVNAGSNDVSVFTRDDGRLRLTDREPSQGERPISVTVRGQLAYVLNAGGDGNIAGFRLREDGTLVALPGTVRPLSTAAAGPAQVGFSPDGRFLVVTEKANNVISLYRVRPRGDAAGPEAFPSAGQTPFGFAFDRRGVLLVSEAFGGAADASALSSYRIGEHGGLRPISPSVGTTETAACWVAVTPDGGFAYVTNTGSASVSGYRVGRRGQLTLLDAHGVTGTTGAAPIDLAFAEEGRLLFTLNSDAHSITGFVVGRDGSLHLAGGAPDLPVGANGMIAW